MSTRRDSICHILPPHILREMAQRGDKAQQALAWDALSRSEQARGQRRMLTAIASIGATSTGVKRRTVYDAKHGTKLPGTLVRGEGGAASKDVMVNEAYDGAGATYDFYMQVYGRNSIDGKGMRLDSTVHYGKKFDNAFWNGQQMVYGDGDGQIFQRFTKVLDVIGHELTHGVTQYEADLEYEDQPGALNESFSDVFGSLVKQYKNKQKAADADWLIGAGLLAPQVHGVALRSMKAPGTAYDDPVLGKDPQPADMKHYVDTTDDNGGVHINSGIPNRAFYETAIRIGGFAWEKVGKIWYVTLCDRLQPNASFQDAAKQTVDVARQLFGTTGAEQKAVKAAWAAVGIKVK